MASLDLLFQPDDRAALELVFGDTGSTVEAPAGALHPAGEITGLGGQITLAYDSNVDRPVLGRTDTSWQNAAPLAAGLRSRFQPSQAATTAARSHMQPARALAGALRAHWQPSQALGVSARQRWQRGAQAVASTRAAFQQALALDHAARQHWQPGAPLLRAVRAGFQQAIVLRAAARQHWQPGAPLHAGARHGMQRALPAGLVWTLHFQDARRPLPGRTARPGTSQSEWCYQPGLPIELVFEPDERAPLDLLFICERHQDGDGTTDPPALIVVLPREVWRMLNSVEIRRVGATDPLPTLDGFSMRLERGSFTWSFGFSMLASALADVQPDVDGLPVELEVLVNGVCYLMLAQKLRRSVQFPKSVVSVSGGSPNALLAAPYAAVQTFSQPNARTAQQLMGDVLTVNGVSMGWSLDWQLTDWPIPAGTWMHQGTWMTAINDIAASVGGYVQPHEELQTLRILPAFPQASWEWGSVTPAIELPNGVATMETSEWLERPGYDTIYLRGEPGVSLFERYKPGSPREVPAPMAVHPLLIHADAARQRAIAELSDTGRQIEQQLSLPVLPETGVIKPGVYVRYTDDDGVARLGLVRSTRVTDDNTAALIQTIGLQVFA